MPFSRERDNVISKSGKEKFMKVKLGAKNCLYPLPTTLVGANVNGKPNYITIAHVGIMNLSFRIFGDAQESLYQYRNQGE